MIDRWASGRLKRAFFFCFQILFYQGFYAALLGFLQGYKMASRKEAV